MAITEFLLARIAEDEAAISAALAPWTAHGYYVQNHAVLAETEEHDISEHIARWDPARVRAECAAKRRVVQLHVDRDLGVHLADEPHQPDRCSCCRRTEWPCSTLRAVASVYAGHPDFDPAWG